MDVGARIRAYLKASGKLYAAGLLDRAEMDRRSARAALLVQRRDFMRSYPCHGTTRDLLAYRRLGLLAQALASGGRVTAIDVGASLGWGVDEIGICTRVGDAPPVTLTFHDETAGHRIPGAEPLVPGTLRRESAFGGTRAVPRRVLLDAAAEAYAAADVVVFHGADADLHRLGIEPDGRVVDTARCARLWHGRYPSLSDLCGRYGIDASGAHHSGNDARYAMDVAVAMTRDPSLPRLGERLELREARDEARRRLATHPTRKGGREVLLAAWRAADEASMRYKTGSLGPSLSLPRRGRTRSLPEPA